MLYVGSEDLSKRTGIKGHNKFVLQITYCTHCKHHDPANFKAHQQWAKQH